MYAALADFARYKDSVSGELTWLIRRILPNSFLRVEFLPGILYNTFED